MDDEIGETMEREIAPKQLRQDRNQGSPLNLIDIRSSQERDIVKLDDDEWIPMEHIPDRLDEIKQMDGSVVLYCHRGQRSLRVAQFLEAEGIDDVYSLAGGVDHWARVIDPDLPTY